MKPQSTIYPALGRFFDSTTDLANACCMSRSKLWSILKGERDFTPQEKKAIVADIMARMFMSRIEETDEVNLNSLYFAYNGHFDDMFKVQ